MKHSKSIILFFFLSLPILGIAQVMPVSFFQGRTLSNNLLDGNALDFDGTNDHLSLPDNTVVPLGNSSYTLEAYIKPKVHNANGIIGWGRYAAVNEVNAFRLGASNTIINYWWANDLTVSLGASLADGKWYHVAATYDGTTRKIYVDGILKGQDTPTTNSHNVPSAANFRIGSTYNGEYFRGSLDEVRIWNVARTQAQIQANMNNELQGDESGLLVYFPFNEGVAGGNNTAITILTNKAAAGGVAVATLVNFTKTGTTSNFVKR
jgi:hypothetical protein